MYSFHESGVVQRMQPIEYHHVPFVFAERFSPLSFDVSDGQRQIASGTLFGHSQHGCVGTVGWRRRVVGFGGRAVSGDGQSGRRSSISGVGGDAGCGGRRSHLQSVQVEFTLG